LLMVRCGSCRQPKPEADFHKSNRNRSGLQSRCKDCQCAARRQCYNPVKASEYDRGYRERNTAEVKRRKADDYSRNIIREKLRRGKNRAIKAGLPADDISEVALLADWKRRGIDPTRCVYTGEPLEDGWHLDHAVPLSHPNTPGHVVTNLVPSNPAVNRGKRRRHWVDFLADRASAQRA